MGEGRGIFVILKIFKKLNKSIKNIAIFAIWKYELTFWKIY